MAETRINHIGMLVPSITEFLTQSEVLYGRFLRGPLMVNAVQRVKEMFISDGTAVLELLEPYGEDSPLAGYLKRNRSGGLVHIALDVDELNAALGHVEKAGGKVIVAPTPDIAFKGRRIAFVVLNGHVTELIERSTS